MGIEGMECVLKADMLEVIVMQALVPAGVNDQKCKVLSKQFLIRHVGRVSFIVPHTAVVNVAKSVTSLFFIVHDDIQHISKV